MTTKERIHIEIDRIGNENLEELYQIIHRFVASKAPLPKPGILSKLRNIQIDAPPDFASNLEQYVNGEKRVEDHLP